jgi:hypothetical protein
VARRCPNKYWKPSHRHPKSPKILPPTPPPTAIAPATRLLLQAYTPGVPVVLSSRIVSTMPPGGFASTSGLVACPAVGRLCTEGFLCFCWQKGDVVDCFEDPWWLSECSGSTVTSEEWDGTVRLCPIRTHCAAPVGVATRLRRRILHAGLTLSHLSSCTEIPKIAHSDWSK